MSRNLSRGVVQVFDTSPASLNLAFMELQNRIDELSGLRGRAMIHDRVRIDNPTVDDDAVALGILQDGSAVSTIPFYVAASTPLLVSAPGTTYIEVSALLRQQVNLASTVDLEARIIVNGWGTESGSAKGVAITQSDGTVLAQITWNGSASGFQLGTFAAVTVLTDQALQVRVKGASATESLILHSIMLDLRYAIDVTNI